MYTPLYSTLPANICLLLLGSFLANIYISGRNAKCYSRELADSHLLHSVLSAALTTGVAVSALVKFFALDYHPVTLKWWGNTVSSAGVDGSSVGIFPIPDRGYFGPEKGSFA